jgi:hypothetical protein
MGTQPSPGASPARMVPLLRLGAAVAKSPPQVSSMVMAMPASAHRSRIRRIRVRYRLHDPPAGTGAQAESQT